MASNLEFALEALLGKAELSEGELARLMTATREYSQMRVKGKFGKGEQGLPPGAAEIREIVEAAIARSGQKDVVLPLMVAASVGGAVRALITDVAFSTNATERVCGHAQQPDPYVLFKSHRVIVGRREDFRRRTSTPTFAGPFAVSFGGPEDSEQLAVELWDRIQEGDELLEEVTIDFKDEAIFGRKTWVMSQGGSGESWYLLLTGESLAVQQRWPWELLRVQPRQMSFDEQGYLVEAWKADPAGHQNTRNRSAVKWCQNRLFLQSVHRRTTLAAFAEIRLMPEAEQLRFLAALQKLMENKEESQSSEYFRLAAYHGWPEDYCAHGQETFPGWHRAYLYEFEQAIIKADQDLGHDGNIGVPYWDWTRLELNGQVLPRIIRENFSELPSGLVDESQAGQLGSRGYRLPSEDRLRQNLIAMQVISQAESCLTVAEHWLHASTRFSRRGFSVESSHNSVHVALGFPMSTVMALKRKSYMLHIFLRTKGQTSSIDLAELSENYPKAAGYAGAGAIFGGRAEDCQNCQKRPPFTVLVNIRRKLQELHLSRHDAEVQVICEDEEETSVPQPVIVGPWFEDDSILRRPASGVEVLQLQKALLKLGYLPEMCCTGVFDSITDALQIQVILCMAAFTARRFDTMPDLRSPGSHPYIGMTVNYAVRGLPGYLERHRSECLAEIDEAMKQWADAAGLKYKRTSEIHARLHISFAPLKDDGPGGRLAEASTWSVVFYLYPVVLHEIGHCLGVQHSSNRADVMWPYYREDQVDAKLSEADKAAVRGKLRKDCTCTVSSCIFDSRGNPTVEVEVTTEKGIFRAAVPSGASTGENEACELRDGGSDYMGKGVKKAVSNVTSKIGPALDPADQQTIDKVMLDLDGTENKTNLGANAILGVSMACCRAGAAQKGISLYRHINELAGKPPMCMPVPCFNVINGGVHAGNYLAFQEFFLIPLGATTFAEAMKLGSETYHNLKSIIKKKYGLDSTAVGDEGGFAPAVNDAEEGLKLLLEAIDQAGHTGKILIGSDPASSEFWKGEEQKYDLDFKCKAPRPEQKKSREEMVALYKHFCDTYPIALLEEGLSCPALVYVRNDAAVLSRTPLQKRTLKVMRNLRRLWVTRWKSWGTTFTAQTPSECRWAWTRRPPMQCS
eukprot:g33572.t1